MAALLLGAFLVGCGSASAPDVITTPARPREEPSGTPTTALSQPSPSITTPKEGEDQPADRVDEVLSGLSLEDKVGQLLMFGFDGTFADGRLETILREWRAGGVVLLGPNVQTPEQVAALTGDIQASAMEETGLGALIAVDQEGGEVLRLPPPFTQFPAAAVVGETGTADLAHRMGRAVAEEMHAVGLNMNLAPVLDVLGPSGSPAIDSRSFGTDPGLVAEMGTAFISGLRDAGVISTGKHFPGHGSAPADSHAELPVVWKEADELQQVDITPFKAAVREGVDAIMTAHVAYPRLDDGLARPATISPFVVGGILRDDLGFDGVVMTDNMTMGGVTTAYLPQEAAVLAIEAGADIILCACPPSVQGAIRSALIEAVQTGRLSEERIDASVRRVVSLKLRYSVGSVEAFDPAMIGNAEHLRVVDDIWGEFYGSRD